MPDRYQDPIDPFEGIGDEVVELGDMPVMNVEETPEGVITTLADGSIEIGVVESPDAPVEEHDSNLAEFIDPSQLNLIGSELLQDIQSDIQSRKPWEDIIEDRLKLLGVEREVVNEPWPNACDLQHTLIAEAAIRFQSNAIMEIFPAEGPVKTCIVGEITKEKQEQSDREKGYLNYLLTEKIEDYRSETEKLLFGLAIFGSAYRKVYEDPILKQPTARYVTAQDFILPYGATSLSTAQRYTERIRISKNELRKLQAAGVYRDVRVDDTPMINNDLQEEVDKLSQQDEPVIDRDDVMLYESHCVMDLLGHESEDGVGLPYVVTIDESGTVLAIRRNWIEGDTNKKKLLHYAAYDFIPGFGPYGFGLLHLVGGSAYAATSIQRQLINAGILANLPGGFISNGLRVKGDDSPHRPGEWKKVSVSQGKLSDSFFAFPYKEPSAVLLQLLGIIVEDGRRLASIADAEIGDVSSQAPVGTTLLAMEKAMKVMSAIQARCHASMRVEFRILVRVIKGSLVDDYPYDAGGQSRKLLASDFDGRIDVIPVSDPNAATMSQRLVQYQMAVQLSQQAPQIYDLPVLHRQVLTVAGVKDVNSIIPDKSNVKPMDPVATIMAITTGKPVKAFPWQDHKAYIQVIDSWMQDPQTAAALGQNPQASAIFAAAQAAKAEHFAYQWRNDIEQELGVPLPGLDQEIPEDVQTHLSVSVAEAARRLLAKDQQQAAQQKAQQQAADPVFQMQMEEVRQGAAEIERKKMADQSKAQLELMRLQETTKTERERIASAERMAAEAALDRGTQFLAEAKLNKPKDEAEIQKMKAQVAEILARIEQMENEPDEPSRLPY